MTEAVETPVVDGCWNFRDALDTAASAGLPVRRGRLFRSDDAVRLTPAGREVVDALGCSTVIDLRQDAQHRLPQRFVADARLVHLPLVDHVLHPEEPQPIRDASELTDLYEGMLDRSVERLGEILDTIARGLEAGPVLFHCAYGKDRAGLVAVVVQTLLGLPTEIVVADYARSDAAAHARRITLVESPLPTDPPPPVHAPPFLFTAPPAAMAELLDRMVARYGSLEAWIATIPVAPDTHERIRRALLDR